MEQFHLHQINCFQMKSLKEQIKNKFGTVRHFCNSSGLKYQKVINVINSRVLDKTYISDLKFYIKNCDPNHRPDVIDTNDRERIRKMLYLNHKTMKAFCQKHREFSPVFLSNVINGKRKKRDARFKRLHKILSRQTYKFTL